MNRQTPGEKDEQEKEFNTMRLLTAAGGTKAAVRGLARDTSNRATILEAFAEDPSRNPEDREAAAQAAAKLKQAAALLQEIEPMLDRVKTASQAELKLLHIGR